MGSDPKAMQSGKSRSITRYFDEWKIGVVVGEWACQGPDSPDLVGFTCFTFQPCCVCELGLESYAKSNMESSALMIQPTRTNQAREADLNCIRYAFHFGLTGIENLQLVQRSSRPTVAVH